MHGLRGPGGHRLSAGSAALSLLALLLALGLSDDAKSQSSAPSQPSSRRCPDEMVEVRGFCIDRWEVSMVDNSSARPLSPYYPPHPAMLARVYNLWLLQKAHTGEMATRNMPLPDLPAWQRSLEFSPRAVSRPNQVPQAYLTFDVARQACANAGKRLCTAAEWKTACQGQQQTKFPYGPQAIAGRCNIHRPLHPALALHGASSIGHTDPRLNLVDEDQKPLLAPTGTYKGCASRWGADAIYDMVGNLDEWVADERGVFMGGFYARATTKGCEAEVASHSPRYYDYSLGARCCADAR
jgi:sulfatase modifying factor 1